MKKFDLEERLDWATGDAEDGARQLREILEELACENENLSLDGEIKGYAVEGLDDKAFRGLKVVVVKNSHGWMAHESTTGISLTPPSWAGGYHNKTREGVLQIVANMFQNIFPESGWAWLQEQLDYDLVMKKS